MKPMSLTVSLSSRGSRYHLGVAITLVAIIPLLCFAYIAFQQNWLTDDAPVWPPLIITAMAFFLAILGYRMLRRYPRAIVQLRGYLEDIAAGELPDRVRMEDKEDDLGAIERTMNIVLDQLRRRVSDLEVELEKSRQMQKTIESQGRELVEAEQHRVMIESLGAACHHIGQPATVLRLYLNILRKHAESEEHIDSIDRCETAVDSIADILDKLRHVSEYRTVPYQTYQGRQSPHDSRILDIDPS